MTAISPPTWRGSLLGSRATIGPMGRTRGLVALGLVVAVAAAGCGGGSGGVDKTAVLRDVVDVGQLCVDITSRFGSVPAKKARVLREVNNLIKNYEAGPNVNIGRWNTLQSKHKRHTVRDALRSVDHVLLTSSHHCNAKAERRAHQALASAGSG
jgi:hypothetical protein